MKKKILHIQVIPKLSGVQKISLEIFKKLPDSQYEKWILFGDITDCGDRENCVSEFGQAGVKVIFSPNLRREICLSDIPALTEIYKLCRREKFDIVHTHSTKPGIVGRIAARLAGIPYIIHTVHGIAFHDFAGFPQKQFYQACELFASAFCHRIVLVNNYYRRYFVMFRRKVLTIHNGIDYTQLPQPGARREIGNTCLRILNVGRLDEQKDPMTLLKAAKIVLQKYPDTTFTIVGDGEKYAQCDNFIKTNGLQNNITLAGWQSDVGRFYNDHDIFAMSSIYEAFGLIFLEAGYYGLPTVATNVEGIPEVVENGVTGLLYQPGDAAALASGMISLIGNPELIKTMGQNARTRVITKFSANAMTDNYLNLYRKSPKK